ncbi:MAG TPA: class I SAM-dependent methyltransferase [Acidimicrobiales bacterium]|nr:class I SAM-dependent methyltransferase [Acidimicrobiales bacterium]
MPGRDAEEREWVAANRAMWDDLAKAHPDTEFYDVSGVVAGRDDLRPWEDQELGPVAGLDLIHLQCHIGTDTIGWARRGARTVGLDFSGEALETAGRLSEACGLEVDWVHGEVYDAVQAVGDRRFDVVYTGVGALGWLPDLRQWAQVVHGLLRPGGRLYLMELHPMWVALIDDGRTVGQDAIGASFERYDNDGSYADPAIRVEHGANYQRLHSLSEVISAVLDVGLTISLFHEYDVTPAPTPWLSRGDDRLYRFPPDTYRFPVVYSLLAQRH